MNASATPEFDSAIEALQYHAEHQGDSLAYKTMDSLGETTETITYLALWLRSHSVAKTIKTHAQAGDRVILLYDNSIEMISSLLACMISNTIAIPCAPLKGTLSPTSISIARLNSIINNANPSLILSSEQHKQRLATYSKNYTPITNKTNRVIHIIDTEAIPTSSNTTTIQLNSIAYLQYTSGTTGTPKGVIITHNNASNNINHLIKGANTPEYQRLQTAVNWLPHHHDMGLINAILIPLYSGCLSIILSPFSFLKRPAAWLQTISNHPGVTSGAPCFAYAHCCKHITDDQREHLDLSSWSLAFVGSDSTRIEQLETFINTFQDCQLDPTIFHPCYGLAETTVHACGDWRLQGIESYSFNASELQKGIAVTCVQSNKRLIAHGIPFPDHKLYIVDGHTQQRLPEKHLGEIWIQGPSVSSGYWDNPSKTDETFINTIKHCNGKFLRTGDIGFIMNRQLFITGRIKETLIIRGQNISPDDIEWLIIKKHPEIQYGQVVAFSLEENHEEQLVVLIHQSRYPEEERLALLKSSKIAILNQLGILPKTIDLVRSPAIPLTTSGKLNRVASKNLYLGHQFTVTSSLMY